MLRVGSGLDNSQIAVYESLVLLILRYLIPDTCLIGT